MSIFNKAISDIKFEDLEELLKENAVENVRLEFKGQMPSKDELLKKISSFANTYGGWLIVGAAEDGTGGLDSFPGIERKKGEKQKIIQHCYNWISPPIDLEVSEPIPTSEDEKQVCYVIFTPESEKAPHFINHRKGVYIRTDEHSQRFEPQLAKLDEILHLSGRRNEIRNHLSFLEKRSHARWMSYAKNRRSNYGRPDTNLGSWLSYTIAPKYPVMKLIENSKMYSITDREKIIWMGMEFPKIYYGIITQQDSVLIPEPGSSFSLLEINSWGVITYFSQVELKDINGKVSGIYLDHLIGHLLVFTRHAQKIQNKFGYNGPLSIKLSLQEIRGVPWVIHNVYGVTNRDASAFDNSSIFELQTDSDHLAKQSDSIVMDLLREVVFALNWPEVANDESRLKGIIKRGYKFNEWRTA